MFLESVGILATFKRNSLYNRPLISMSRRVRRFSISADGAGNTLFCAAENARRMPPGGKWRKRSRGRGRRSGNLVICFSSLDSIIPAHSQTRPGTLVRQASASMSPPSKWHLASKSISEMDCNPGLGFYGAHNLRACRRFYAGVLNQ